MQKIVKNKKLWIHSLKLVAGKLTIPTSF